MIEKVCAGFTISAAIVVGGLFMERATAAQPSGFFTQASTGSVSFGVLDAIDRAGGSGRDGDRGIIYVDDDNTSGPWDGSIVHPYEHIIDGLEHAATGDTIFVRAGIYLERLIIDRSVTLLGEGSELTTIDAGGAGEVVNVLADNVTISGFTLTGAAGSGALVLLSDGNAVHDNHLTENDVRWGAVYLYGSSNNDIYDNHVQYTVREAAIWLNEASCWNVIIRNTLENNGFNGVVLWNGSSYNEIVENTIRDNRNGIWVYNAPDNLFADNTFSKNHFEGISIDSSSNTVITGNHFGVGGGVSFDYLDREVEYWATHTIEDNDIEGAPIYYYLGAKDVIVPADAAQIILVNSSDCTISGHTLDTASNPVQAAFCCDLLISDNSIVSDWYGCGITLVATTDTTIQGNTLTSTYTEYVSGDASGIEAVNIEEGGGNSILDNDITGFHYGILLRNWDATSDNRISENRIASFQSGMLLIQYNETGDGNVVSDNAILGGSRYGLGVSQWTPSTIANNRFVDTGMYVMGYELDEWLGYTITGNTVNNKPIRHFENAGGIVVPEGAGQVILVDCPDFVVQNQHIIRASVGVTAAFSPGGLIHGNEIEAGGVAGVWLYESSKSECVTNRIRDCGRGVYVDQGSDFSTIRENLIQDSITAAIGSRRVTGVQILENMVGESSSPEGYPLTYGFRLDRTADSVIASNDLQCAADFGMFIMDSSDNEVSGNSIAGSALYGIFLRDTSTRNVITHNQLIANGTNASELYADGNIWSVDGAGNFWSDFADNPGYPDSYEIPGDGDGVDQAPLESAYECPFLTGDINGTCGEVDFEDFVLFAECWDAQTDDCGDYGCSDLNGDGEVDLRDFAMFSVLYGTISDEARLKDAQ